MPFLDRKPVVITKRNVDDKGNPISVKQVETKQVAELHNCIPLNYSIDRNHEIAIFGMYQVYNKDEITKTTYFADYDQGILYFHPDLKGKSLTVTYMATGYILISSDRIFRYNYSDGSTGSLESSFEKIENLLKQVLAGNVTADNISAEVIGSRTDALGKTYKSLGDRLNSMEEKIGNASKIIVYKNVVNVVGTTTTVEVGISDYVPDSDHLNVYLAGVRMIEGIDYTLNKAAKSISCMHAERWTNGDQLHFEVFKKAADLDVSQYSVYASNVIVEPEVLGQNNVQKTLQTLANKSGVASVMRYNRVTENTKTINVGINNYNPTGGDILNVFMQGIRMVKDVDYTLNETNKSITNIKGDWISGDEILFEVITPNKIATVENSDSQPREYYENRVLIQNSIETISDLIILNEDSLIVDTGFDISYMDKLSVYVNGVRLIDNVDYVLTNNSIASCIGKWKTGDKIYLELEKKSVFNYGSIIYNTNTDLINILEDTNTVRVSLPNFNIATDKVTVYLNGIRLINEIDYMINSKNKTIMSCGDNWKCGDRLYVELDKRELI